MVSITCNLIITNSPTDEISPSQGYLLVYHKISIKPPLSNKPPLWQSDFVISPPLY